MRATVVQRLTGQRHRKIVPAGSYASPYMHVVTSSQMSSSESDDSDEGYWIWFDTIVSSHLLPLMRMIVTRSKQERERELVISLLILSLNA